MWSTYDWEYTYRYRHAEALQMAEARRRARLARVQTPLPWRRRLAGVLFSLSCWLDQESCLEQPQTREATA